MTQQGNARVEELLNKIISASLFEPSSDPSTSEIWCALYAYDALKTLGLKIRNENEVVECFKPDGNVHEENFLKWLGK